MMDTRGLPEPVALARMITSRGPDDWMQRPLAQLYCAMSPADQLRCKAELARIKAAKRGECIAEIAA